MHPRFAAATFVPVCLLTMLLVNSSGAEEPAGPKKARPRTSHKRLEERKQRAEKAPKASVDKPAGRYQLLSAGQRVVILDTHTGETQVIEPSAPAYQNVEVGRAWVVVTVLGNVSERRGTLPADKP
jgi:hypothetical protein